MSNYIHPMQQQYNLKVSQILSTHRRHTEIQINAFISLLTQYQIKFFSKDDVTKFTKLCNPFDKLNINQAFIHLEFIYVQNSPQAKYFFVKFTGKMFKTLNMKPVQLKKANQLHSIQQCITDFRRKMTNVHGKENFWFRALGGMIGTNTIKRQLLYKKITKIFTNTCHSNCINNFMEYVTEVNEDGDIIWQQLRRKINVIIVKVNQSPQKSILKGSRQINNQNQGLLPQIKYPGNVQKGFRITTLIRHNQMSASQHITQFNVNDNQSTNFDNNSPIKQQLRRRLKTLGAKPKFLLQSYNLQSQINYNKKYMVNQDIIHSKNRYKIFSPNKKCKTSLDQY